MDITDYRLTSMEEPTDEQLHELMKQVAESARESSANARRVLQEMMDKTVEKIRRDRLAEEEEKQQ